jgi:hypothetical protein
MFLSSINSILNLTFLWITSAVFSAFYCGWYAKKMMTLGVNGLSLVPFTHSSFLFQQLFSAQGQQKVVPIEQSN